MDGDKQNPIITGIVRKPRYSNCFPLPRRRFQRDHLRNSNHEQYDNGDTRTHSRFHNDNLKHNMKHKRYASRNHMYRKSFNNNQPHKSVQDRIDAIRSNNSQNSNHYVRNNNYSEDAASSSNYNHNNNNTFDDSGESVDMDQLQYKIKNVKDDEEVQMNNVVDDDDDEDEDEQIDDATDLTVQVVNDKLTKNTEQISRFKMVLDARVQLTIKKIQSRNKTKQVVYPYPVTPHHSGLSTNERFSIL